VRTGTEMRVGEKFGAVGHEQRGVVWGPLRSKRIGGARVSALIMSERSSAMEDRGRTTGGGDIAES
jgi:hypothetical protein